METRIGRIEKLLGERECPGCRLVKRVRVIRRPEDRDPASFVCSTCGRRKKGKFIVLRHSEAQRRITVGT